MRPILIRNSKNCCIKGTLVLASLAGNKIARIIIRASRLPSSGSRWSNGCCKRKPREVPAKRITERVNCMGDPDSPKTPRPLLALEEFFAGNFVVGSISCSLHPAPEPAQFFNVLKAIALRPEVRDIVFWSPSSSGFVDQSYEPYSISTGPDQVASWWD